LKREARMSWKEPHSYFLDLTYLSGNQGRCKLPVGRNHKKFRCSMLYYIYNSNGYIDREKSVLVKMFLGNFSEKKKKRSSFKIILVYPKLDLKLNQLIEE
jgi:hypothetical protein